VVYGLIVVNFVVFLSYTFTNSGQGIPAQYALIPRALTMGTNSGIATPVPAWITLFTHMFLHANWLHIGGNMLYLWIFGNNIEDVLGHFRFLVFYLLSGLCAAGAQIIGDPTSAIPMLGASGAIAGVLGAYLILFPRARVVTLVILIVFIQVVAIPAEWILGYWIVLQVVDSVLTAAAHAGAQGGVAFLAHIGGFVSGMIMTLLLGGRRLLQGRGPTQYSSYRNRYDW
jgi:membrane associated rhomboid family serine protease